MKRNHPAHGPKTLCNACGVRLSRRVKAADKAKPLPRSSGTEQPKPAAADKQALAYDKPVRARLPTKQALQSQGYPGVLHDRADRGALGKLHVGSGDKPPLSLEQQQAASRVGDAPRSGSKRRIPCDDASPTKHSRTGCAPLLSLCCRACSCPRTGMHLVLPLSLLSLDVPLGMHALMHGTHYTCPPHLDSSLSPVPRHLDTPVHIVHVRAETADIQLST